MNGCGYRANLLTGGCLTMRTSHWLVHHLHIDRITKVTRLARPFEVALEITVQANPMHFSTASDLIFSHDRNIVFRLAGDDASIATHAFIEIDCHAPLRQLGHFGFLDPIDGLFPHRHILMVRSIGSRSKVLSLNELLQVPSRINWGDRLAISDIPKVSKAKWS